MSASSKNETTFEQNILLMMDADEINRGILANLFSAFYTVEEAENGKEGLEKIRLFPEKYCAFLLDVAMPAIGGIDFLKQLKADGIPNKIPVFLIMDEANDNVMKEAYRLGVMDVISKPIVPYVVLRRVQSVIELFQARKRLSSVVEIQQSELLAQAQKIIDLNQGMIEALAAAIEFRNGESGEHVHRIHDITKFLLTNTKLGRNLNREDIDSIALAAVMHDVGKIAIPDAILNKPGKLTPDEYEIMKTHTVQGALLLEKIPQLKENNAYQYAYDIARHHHERWDGKGYPDGLKGNEISIWAQVVALADVYDALSCKRVYKDAFPREKVLEMIRNGECGAFNPHLLNCFFSVEEKLSKMYEKQ